MGFQLLTLLFPLYARYASASTTYGATFGLMLLLLAGAYLLSQRLVLGAETNAVYAADPTAR